MALGSRSISKRLARLAGEGALPFDAAIEQFVADSGKPAVRWLARDLRPLLLHRAADLFAEGHTVREVGVLFGISRSEAGRMRQRAVAEGLLESSGENESDEGETVLEGSSRLN